MLAAEAHNNVFGQSKNPVVSHLNCGGSSGGEGSVMAYNGSALGIGTDVAGSIRLVRLNIYYIHYQDMKPSDEIFELTKEQVPMCREWRLRNEAFQRNISHDFLCGI